jgi:hypothetical protein
VAGGLQKPPALPYGELGLLFYLGLHSPFERKEEGAVFPSPPEKTYVYLARFKMGKLIPFAVAGLIAAIVAVTVVAPNWGELLQPSATRPGQVAMLVVRTSTASNFTASRMPRWTVTQHGRPRH